MRYSWQNRKEIVLYIKERKRFVCIEFSLYTSSKRIFSQSRSLESKFRFHTIRFFSEWHTQTRILYILFLQKISLFYLQLKLQKLFYNRYCNISQNILKEGKKFQKNSLFVFYNFLLIFFITFLFFLFFAIHFIKLIEKFRCRFIKILL